MARVEQIKRAAITVVAAGAGDNAVVAAVVGKRIRVLGYVFAVSAAGVNPKWRSAANDLTGAFPLGANGVLSVAEANPEWGAGWFETNTGEALNLNVAAAGNVSGHLVYEEITP
jgi:hypothetical protein